MANGTLLSKATLEQMRTPAKLANGQDARVSGQRYGLGWQIGTWRGHRQIAHQGASGTMIMRFPDDGLTVIVLTNLANPSVGFGDIGIYYHNLFASNRVYSQLTDGRKSGADGDAPFTRTYADAPL